MEVIEGKKCLLSIRSNRLPAAQQIKAGKFIDKNVEIIPIVNI